MAHCVFLFLGSRTLLNIEMRRPAWIFWKKKSVKFLGLTRSANCHLLHRPERQPPVQDHLEVYCFCPEVSEMMLNGGLEQTLTFKQDHLMVTFS